MKNILKIQHLLLVLIIGLPLSSCLKNTDTDADKRQQEEQQIANYVKAKGYNVSPSATGLYYISEVTGTGDTPRDSDFVVIQYRAWTLDDKLFDSTDTTDVTTYKIMPWYYLTGPLKFSMRVNFPGWIETFKNMKAGGKAIAIMPSILSYNDFVPRKYEIELLEVIHNNYTYEKQKINSYLTAMGKEIKDTLDSGIFYTETGTGTGAAPSSGKIASVQYTGKLINGKVFDKTTSAANFNFTIGTGAVVSGFEEAVNRMKVGGKSTVVIPFYRAYGANYRVNVYTNQIVIPWYSTLVFDLELVKVQ